MAGSTSATKTSAPPHEDVPSSSPCSFYALGKCKYGASCKFAHVDAAPAHHSANTSSPNKAPCKFYIQGTCTAGRDCKFSHDVDADAMKRVTSGGEHKLKPGALRQRCRFFDKGGCAAGSTCPYVHVESKESGKPRASSSRLPSQTLPGSSIGRSIQMHVLTAKAPEEETNVEATATALERLQETKAWGDADGDAEQGLEHEHVQDMSEFLTKEEELYYYGAPGEFESDPNELDWMEAKPSYAQVTGMDAVGDDGGFHEEMPAAPRICTFFLQGLCRYGDSCFYSHSLDTPPSADDRAWIEAEMEASKELECGICYDNVLAKGERFGLLSGCSHAFCLECVRSWRGTTDQAKQTLRQCPVCRVETHFIIPSNRMVVDPDRKAALIQRYKENLSAIPCRHFDEGRGTCPFGTSCFYAHRYPDGTLEERQVRTAVDSDGHYDVLQQVRLEHYFKKVEL